MQWVLMVNVKTVQVYRTYQVPRNPQANQVETEQKNGRDFIKALIEVAGSDINAAVREKNIPDAKTPCYTAEGSLYLAGLFPCVGWWCFSVQLQQGGVLNLLWVWDGDASLGI